jgi:hypothetical protein
MRGVRSRAGATRRRFFFAHEAAQTIANNATVAVNSSAGITVRAGGSTDFLIDVFGYYF